MFVFEIIERTVVIYPTHLFEKKNFIKIFSFCLYASNQDADAMQIKMITLQDSESCSVPEIYFSLLQKMQVMS